MEITKYPLEAGIACLMLSHKVIDRWRERHLAKNWGLARADLKRLNEENLARGKGLVITVFESCDRRWAIATDLEKKRAYLAPAELIGVPA